MIPMSLNAQTTLLVIDIQQRLAGAMDQPKLERVVHNTQTLIQLARQMGASVVYSEQYPKGLGPTLEVLKDELEQAHATRIEKTHFDILTSPVTAQLEVEFDPRVVVCGMEAHICVLSTVSSLLEHHEVLVPMDCVLSRSPEHLANGLAQMGAAGAHVTNVETLVFGSLGDASHEAFKRFSKRIK